MTLSIIVPVYNTQNYLRQCLDSIVNQTFSDFELIIVDDGSTDDSLKIAEEYEKKDGRIKIIHQKNTGIVGAVRTGVLHSNGDYISFVDSDDYCELNKYEIMVKNGIAHNCDMVACGIKSEENIRPCLAKPGYYNYDDIIKTIYKNCFLLGGYCCRYNKIIKKEILMKNFDLYQNISQSNEDYVFFSSFFFNVKSMYVCSEILCNVRTISSTNSTTKKNRSSITEQLPALYEYLFKLFALFGKEKLFYQAHNLFFNSIKTSIVAVSRENNKNDAIEFIKNVCNMNLIKKVCKHLSWKYYPTNHWKDKILVVLFKLKFYRLIYRLAK